MDCCFLQVTHEIRGKPRARRRKHGTRLKKGGMPVYVLGITVESQTLLQRMVASALELLDRRKDPFPL